jgi:hypothetical protein
MKGFEMPETSGLTWRNALTHSQESRLVAEVIHLWEELASLPQLADLIGEVDADGNRNRSASTPGIVMRSGGTGSQPYGPDDLRVVASGLGLRVVAVPELVDDKDSYGDPTRRLAWKPIDPRPASQEELEALVRHLGLESDQVLLLLEMLRR